MNLPIHASLVEHALLAFPEATQLLRQPPGGERRLSIAALGGGPGSELLGFAKVIQGLQPPTPLAVDFSLIDLTKQWDDSWHALKVSLDRSLSIRYGPNPASWPLIVSRSFLPLDLSCPEELKDFGLRFRQVGLVVCCYLVSEVQTSIEPLRTTIRTLATLVAPGALFLFVDRDQAPVRQAILSLMNNGTTLIPLHSHSSRGRQDLQLTKMGSWHTNIESLPRRRWQAFLGLASTPQAARRLAAPSFA